MNEWSEHHQQARRKQLYETYLMYMGDVVGENGESTGGRPKLNFREALWHSLILLDAGGQMAQRANGIIESVVLPECTFSPMTSLQILLKYEDRLTERAVVKLEKYVRESLSWAADDSVHFTMYNDNFAAMASFTLLAAGERFKDKEAFRAGMEKLKQLKDVLTRCGTIMEYNSPTYTPITTHVLAEIVNHIQNEEARPLALLCEERMWAEIAVRYHAPTSHLAGPYSRAYMVDSVGHPHCLNGLLYLVFGESEYIHPLNSMFPMDERQVIHIGAEVLMWPNLVWLCSGTCHCPDHLAELLLFKKFPFQVTTTSECLPGTEYAYLEQSSEYGAWSGPHTTYMTEDYAMGTAYGQFFDGAVSDSFHIVYRKAIPSCRLADTGVVFSRYLFDERKPEEENVYNGRRQGPEMLRDEGRKFGLQHRDCAMVVYKPKPYEAQQTKSMKLSILFPAHYDTLDEVWLGNRKLEDFTGESLEPVHVYIKDGPVYMAFKPLYLTDHGRMAAVKVEKLDRYVMLSFYNYEGDRRSFEPKLALLTTNGFIAHVKQASEFTSFSEFIRFAEKGKVEDHTAEQLGGHTRWIRYIRDDLCLDFAYSPISEGIMVSSINGKPRPSDVFKATGFNSGMLPFLPENDSRIRS